MDKRTAIPAAAILLTALAIGAEANAQVKLSKCGPITEPGSYEVTKNIVAADTCFEIAADLVTLDLMGHNLVGDGTGAGITAGTGVDRRHGIVVRDGSVTMFESGVDLRFAESSTIERIRATDNALFGIRAGVSSSVVDNTAAFNGEDGINVGSGSTVSGNTARENGRDGILAVSASTVSGNAARGNGDDGISVGSGSTVTGNAATLNGDDGITVSDSTVSGNTARENGDDGIRVTCPSNVIFNTATGNSGNNFFPSDLLGAGCNDFQNLGS